VGFVDVIPSRHRPSCVDIIMNSAQFPVAEGEGMKYEG
jgi:hypothetical protein